jgi:hypothetical protein
MVDIIDKKILAMLKPMVLALEHVEVIKHKVLIITSTKCTPEG